MKNSSNLQLIADEILTFIKQVLWLAALIIIPTLLAVGAPFYAIIIFSGITLFIYLYPLLKGGKNRGS